MLGGLPPERGRGNNGPIMDGRGPGVDGRRKRRWRREDGGCNASDGSPWFQGVDWDEYGFDPRQLEVISDWPLQILIINNFTGISMV